MSGGQGSAYCSPNMVCWSQVDHYDDGEGGREGVRKGVSE